ncbi:small GTPase superfamily protein, partial [Kipferlia bialata]|eukprot:g11741.t1
MADLDDDGDFDLLYKVLLIGNSSVGKTALLCAYCDGTFSSSYISTIGIDFRSKIVDVEDTER